MAKGKHGKIEKKSSRSEWRRRKRRRALIIRACSLTVLLVVLSVAVWGVSTGIRRSSEKRTEEKAAQEALIRAEEEALENRKRVLAEAEILAAGYDYDGAIDLLQSIKDYDQDADLLSAAAKYSAEKSMLTTVDAGSVQHLLFRPLIYDQERAFSVSLQGNSTVDLMKSWTITTEEFSKILEEMYSRGYVFISIHDLITETKASDGTVALKKNTSLKLPEGKKPVILSIDDMSYYHDYENCGFADKLVVTQDGKIKAQYTDLSGNVSIGDFDIVPIMETFFEAHPDASYKGARGLITLSGYNGILGYRTDNSYRTGMALDAKQQKWLNEQENFDWNKEVEAAKQVAEALKEKGWEFACGTWGKINLSNASAETVQADHEKWVDTVQSIVGETDVLVFPYGMDMGTWKDYSDADAVYAYYKNQGMKVYCNIDTSGKVWVQIRSAYLRQGRINVDGAMLNKMRQGKTDVLNDIFDVNTIIGSFRTS